jgi:hypothetical protein
LQAPPGQPIAAFVISNWAPAWRRKFFSDWRQDSNGKTYSKCNLCKANRPYLTGNLSSFTNFSKHLKGVHLAEWNAYDEDQSKKKGDTTQQSIKAYGTAKSIHKSRQQQLDIQLAYSMAEDNIPFNILRRPRFKEWIQVTNRNKGNHGNN